MSKLLYIIANPNPVDLSFGRKVSDFVVDKYRVMHPEAQITVRDLYREGVRLLDEGYLTARRKLAMGQADSLTHEERAAVQSVEKTADEFVAHDRYIIATPMWNFGDPPLLKAYVDHVIVPGKTFKYTAEGPIGLMADGDRRMIIIESTGGFYSGGPTAKLNHCSTYLADIFGFTGIKQLKVLPVEGTAIPGHSDVAVENANKAAMLALSEF